MIWGLMIAAAVMLAGLLAWTYTVPPDDVDDISRLVGVMDLFLLWMAAALFALRFEDRMMLVLRPTGHWSWRKWRGAMPVRAVRLTAVMAAVSFALTAYYMSTSGLADGMRLRVSAGVLFLSLGSVEFSEAFRAGTSRTTGRR
ncbi:hypothetical protein UK23_04635 [Lentzea aerocolonigenes]|uniref:Uncharacterized protein n=1 Tax=Lentzea aerocolonigenes TaxID=68170 RepID=A0A0F0H958_LENAE|nr:hypothetical protein UK23_04635 [Lentzea aerocolonigenes]